MYDILIIGAGVSGCAIARELSQYEYKIGVLEKAADVCEGTSKANSGIVHAGFDAKPGTVKAALNLKGALAMEDLCRTLEVPYKQNGSLVICEDETGLLGLEGLLAKGRANGVEGLRLLNKEELTSLEPNIGSRVYAALHAKTGGIVCPFSLTIALAESACENGVEFHLHNEVQSIVKEKQGYLVHTTRGTYETKVLINAAGVYGDVIHYMVSKTPVSIVPRKGEYCLFDKEVGSFVKNTVFQLPTAYGKGILVTPTVHGNLLIGPTATDILDKEGTDTTAEGLAEVVRKAGISIDALPLGKVITSFAGLRAHEEAGDFIIEEAKDARGFIDVIGIESPGLTCAPALGGYVAQLVKGIITVKKKKKFKEDRNAIPSMAEADTMKRQELIVADAAYGNVICRCELVTEGEIMAAINRPLGATTLDGVKRRTRAGMGRCQGGFCGPKIVEILARELGVDESQITKVGGGKCNG